MTTTFFKMDQENASFWEKLTRILIKIRVFPVHINFDDKAKFDWLTCNTLVSISIYTILWFLPPLMSGIIWPDVSIDKVYPKYFEAFGSNQIDGFAGAAFSFTMFLLGLESSLLIGKAIPNLWEIVKMKKNLCNPLITSFKLT